MYIAHVVVWIFVVLAVHYAVVLSTLSTQSPFGRYRINNSNIQHLCFEGDYMVMGFT